jgi:hypothetical protein
MAARRVITDARARDTNALEITNIPPYLLPSIGRATGET